MHGDDRRCQLLLSNVPHDLKSLDTDLLEVDS